MSFSSSSSTERPCGACKFLRRKCRPDCLFAPHFPPDQIELFKTVNSVYGTSNVAKILRDLQPEQRADAVQSLVHNAIRRMQDRIYGCPGDIYLLQQALKEVDYKLAENRREQSWIQSSIPAHFHTLFLQQPQNFNLHNLLHQQEPQNFPLQQSGIQGMGTSASGTAPSGQQMFLGGSSSNGRSASGLCESTDPSAYNLFPFQGEPRQQQRRG